MIKINHKFKTALQQYKFIDLFCGIGGFHQALSSFGAECVFASDIDVVARDVYKQNFKHEPYGDIKEIDVVKIPKHDILCAGFPCQAFSISGNQAGFGDKKTGNLFFEIIRIAKHHKPKMIFLENVANLTRHNGKKTLERILKELEIIGYTPCFKILCASDYNIPQVRKRVYFVAFRNDIDALKFEFPKPKKLKCCLEDLLQPISKETNASKIDRDFNLRDNITTLEENSINPYIRIGEIGKGRQGERIYSTKGCAVTLSSSGGGLGGRTGIYLINNYIRKLTPRECARLMGFPDSFQLATTYNQSYQQFGNSVVIDVLQYIIIEAINVLEANKNE